jgi:hypothetical protein
MKKSWIIFAVIALITAFAVIGCASTGGGKKLDRYTADLSKFEMIKNTTPIPAVDRGFLIPFPEFPVDITQFRRITVRAKAYDARGNDITAWSDNGVLRMHWDLSLPDGDGPGQLKNNANVLFTEVNCGYEGLGQITHNEGVIAGMTPGGPVPAGLSIESNSANVKFLEITQITFHNGTAAAPAGPGTFVDADLGAFDMVFKPNFQYGRTWNSEFRKNELLNGYKLTQGDKFVLKVTYTTSRDIPNPMSVAFCNTGSSPWVFISFNQIGGEEAPTTFPASKAGEVVSASLEFEILRNGGGGAAGNALIWETVGRPTDGPLTLSFTEFTLKKIN